ncbi:MAG: hypothetical protein QOH49_1882 [Acidobacteriota bacterium]|jgi:hypothetical protein|nr:hypothetical protein [Acidobacteriota bacterium]
MKKKFLNVVALSALTLLLPAALSPREASAQEVASVRTPVSGRATAGGGARLLKRMTLSTTETAEGSRVRITSDAALDGYRTYTEGGRFFVLVPEADAAVLASGGFAARGFTRVEAGQRGDDALIAFTLAPNVAPRVRATFNRLEILFAAQTGQQPTGGGEATASPSPTPPPAAPTNAASDGKAATPEAKAATTTPAGGGVAAAPGTSAARLAALLTPEKMQPTQLVRFDKAPVIDGKLDEEIWKTAAVFKDFVQFRPVDLVAPSQATEVRIGYDSRFLYVGFRAYDEPGKVRATIAKRDAVFDDDWVGIWLDTFNDGRRAYELIFNPLGVQADAIFTEGVNEDFSVDIVHESKGVLLEDGYTVEVAIPFKSLRYEAGKDKRWGLHLLRTIKRLNNEQSTWMPISRDNSSLLGQEGHVTGLEGLSTERTIELIPSLTISEAGSRVPSVTRGRRALSEALGIPVPGDSGRFLNSPVEFDPGLTAKFGISPTMTLDMAINPDFAQVEADATVVTANQRFPIFFEEKRPFFLEGKEIFETLLSAVHTRSIVDPDYAFKFTGKRGRNTYGLMFASDKAPGNLLDDDRDFLRATEDLTAVRRRDAELGTANADDLQSQRDSLMKRLDRNATIGVLRFKRDIGKEGHIGFLGTSYNFVDKYNQVGGFDVRYRFDKKLVFSAQALGSVSHQPFFYPDEAGQFDRKEKGLAYAYNFDWAARNWGWNYSAVGRSRLFRADVGFDRRYNTHNQDFFWRYQSNDKPKAKIVSWRFFNNSTFNFDWKYRSQFFQNESQIQLKMQKQTFVGFGVEEGYERVFESEFGPSREGFALANSRNERLAGLSVPACLNFERDPVGGRSAELNPCTFFGEDPERSADNRDLYFYVETHPSKKYSISVFSLYRWGQMDFDFGTGNPRFPRVSPAAQQFGQNAPLDPGAGNQWTVESSFTYQPTDALRMSLNYNKARLVRQDTGLVAFDDDIYSLRGTYQFTRFIFARGRVDYTSLGRNARGQFLLGWTPNPGTSFYVGYNDDMNRNGLNPFSRELEPGFRRNGRLFFIKMSYLIRKSIGE